MRPPLVYLAFFVNTTVSISCYTSSLRAYNLSGRRFPASSSLCLSSQRGRNTVGSTIVGVVGRRDLLRQTAAFSAAAASSSSISFLILQTSSAAVAKATMSSSSSKGTLGSSALKPNWRSPTRTTPENSDAKSVDVVRWGIVGLGDVCAKKSGPAFWKCDGYELVAVMKRTPGAAARWAEENVPGGECRGYDTLDEFLRHPGGLDAVYVATPPGSHLDVVRRVAEAGGTVSACYVEKPVGRSGWETEEMARILRESDVMFYTAYISRAYERTGAVRTLLAEGAVGDGVTSIEYTLRGTGGARGMDQDELPWRLDASRSGGGLIMDVGCHLIDRIDYLFGPLVHVEGKAMNRHSPHLDVEDYVHLRASVGPSTWAAVPSEGASVECTWDFGASGEDDATDELVIRGPGGSLRMAAMSPFLPITVLDADCNVVRKLTFDAPEHTAQPLVQSITDHLRGIPGAMCLSDGDNAIRTSKVLDSVLGDYYCGRDDEFWLRPETWPGRPSARQL